jgi:hypothetical protein
MLMDFAVLDFAAFTFVTADVLGRLLTATMVNPWVFERTVNFSVSL